MHIYRFTNRVNGKVYIGRSSQNGLREREHINAANRGSRHHAHFYSALRKYGAENFLIEIIHCAKTEAEMLAMETFFIILHQSFKPENGYNRTLGGDGGGSPSADTRRLLSVAAKGKPSPRKGAVQIFSSRYVFQV